MTIRLQKYSITYFLLIYSVLQTFYALCRDGRLFIGPSVKSFVSYRTSPLIVTAGFEFLTALSKKESGPG